MDRKVALITGGVRGIGHAVATMLAGRGWAVAASYRASEEAAALFEAEMRNMEVPGGAVRCDVSDPAAAADLVRLVESRFGRVDALINCAGPFRRVHLLEETAEGWLSMFENNLHPVFYLSQAVAPGMKARRWGRIVNFSMVNADRLSSQPHITAHYISKCGVLVLTRTLARILAPYGITANAISPGFIETGSGVSEDLAGVAAKIPAGYIGTPEDAASAVAYLLSDEARYVNGTNLHVSGAWGI